MEVEPVQQATWHFFLPLFASYLTACAAWLLLYFLYPNVWPKPAVITTKHKWLDFSLVFVAAAFILVIGQVLYRNGYLLPSKPGWMGWIIWNLNNLIIYSPMFILLAIRRQSNETLYLSLRRFWIKFLFGLGIGIVSVVLFAVLRNEVTRLPKLAMDAVHPENLQNFLPVFLEGVVLAFGFVRLRWLLPLWAALVIPSMIFAFAHVPGQIENQRTMIEIGLYFSVNTILTASILYVVQKSRDVIWIGIVHYLMDIAIDAF